MKNLEITPPIFLAHILPILGDNRFGGNDDLVGVQEELDAGMNAKADDGWTPLDRGTFSDETADLFRKHGGKTAEELK